MRFYKDKWQPLFKKTGSAEMAVSKYNQSPIVRYFALTGYPVHRAT